MKIDLLYSDEHLLVVNKPAGLLSIPDRFDPELPSLSHVLGRKIQGPILPLHRLDRPTSGLITFARTTDAQRELSRQFEERSVKKIYLALVEGRPHEPEGLVDQAIAPHPSKLGKMMVSAKGKSAQTKYQVVDFFGGFSLLEIELLTGRTHQIRVHLSYIGHPLLVDEHYGNRSSFLLSTVKGRRYRLKKGEEERPLLARAPLHAAKLGFHHPVSGELLSFEREIPKDMRATINQLKKLN
ncbi:MAG: RluA family pseudouridine synthase [Bacteroidota bacterium]